MTDESTGLTETQRQVIHWLATGHVGSSSKTMAMWLAFNQRTRDWSHPHDPDDLDRCLALLKAAPGLREALPRMAELSPTWKALVERWAEIEQSHCEEVGLGWWRARTAPKTYRLMREVIDGTSA